MADVLVLGGGWCGLTTGLLLDRDGHRVTVLEKDAAAPDTPADAWEQWPRAGVAQFRQPHILLPRAKAILDAELPELTAELRAAGGVDFSLFAPVAAMLPAHAHRPDDVRFTTVTARRPVAESVVARHAEQRLDVRRGAVVAGLLARTADGVPAVTGVRLASGEQLTADVIVDATGRRSRTADWLAELGAQPPQLAAERDGFTYYSRFFRSPDGSLPEVRGPVSFPYGSISVLTLPGDNGTWSVTVYVQSRDQEVKAVRHPDAFARVVAACPPQAHWLDGEPITDVLAMSGVLDQRRDFTGADGLPVATGLLVLGDAWASTNPSLGRGLSVGLLQAVRLRDALRLQLDPAPLAKEWARLVAEEFAPWHDSAVDTDRCRVAEIDAIRAGRPVPAATDPVTRLRLAAVVTGDPDLFRALFEITSVLSTPQQVLARPDVATRLDALEPRDLQDVQAAPPPGPDRRRLLELIAG